MFSTFKEGYRTVIVRSASIVSMVDIPGDQCMVTWEAAGQVHQKPVDGTAAENYARLQREELAAIEASTRIQQRLSQGYPADPIRRGRS